MKKGNILFEIPGRLMVYIYTIFLLTPMYFIVVTALKSGEEVYTNPLGLPARVMLNNFIEAFVKGNMLRYSINSIIITVSSVVLILLNNIIVSYGIYKLFNKKIGAIIYSFIIGSMMIPGVGLVAYIIMMQKLHLYNNLHGLIISSAAASLPFNVFILLGFLRTIPRDLEDAAIIDGCSDFQSLFYVIIPIVKPAITALGIFAFVGSWNNLMGPLILLKDPNLFTIPIGLTAFRGTYTVQYNLLFAAILIASVPLVILYLKFQDNFVESLSGSIKG